MHHDAAVIHRWPRCPRAVPRARTELRKALTGWGLAALEDPAALVLSELLTNAVRHARAPRDRHIETRLLVLRTADALAEVPTGVRIEVHDASYGQPRLLTPDFDAPGGRGLLLVAALAERWGVSARLGPGKAVWAELLA